jgi:uncharacterized protein (DUF488 family)
MDQRRVWTIGHSTHPLDVFIELLTAHTITAVADVRKYPASRRYPQFNQQPLSNALASRAITYVHYPDLGGRRVPRPDSRNTRWRNAQFRGYADYMQTAEFHHAIGQLMQTVATYRTAILCAEALWWKCHRSLIADLLKANGLEVIHILANSETELHPYTSAAHIEDGHLTYTNH